MVETIQDTGESVSKVEGHDNPVLAKLFDMVGFVMRRMTNYSFFPGTFYFPRPSSNEPVPNNAEEATT